MLDLFIFIGKISIILVALKSLILGSDFNIANFLKYGSEYWYYYTDFKYDNDVNKEFMEAKKFYHEKN